MTLQSIIDNAKRIAFFGGAGVSTESNIPDFRSPDGLYNQKYDYMPAEILSHNFFIEGTLVIINKSPTFLDGKADLVINANIGETLNAIKI